MFERSCLVTTELQSSRRTETFVSFIHVYFTTRRPILLIIIFSKFLAKSNESKPVNTVITLRFMNVFISENTFMKQPQIISLKSLVYLIMSEFCFKLFCHHAGAPFKWTQIKLEHGLQRFNPVFRHGASNETSQIRSFVK